VLFLKQFVKGVVFFLPTRRALRFNWNFGSMLGMVFILQLVSGLFLVFYYSPDSSLSFSSVQYLMVERNFGWVLRIAHFNGASLFFFFLYLHFFKGLFFNSFRLVFVWFSGLLLFVFLMAEAFMGYVLVWAQISFWASVVITSLLSVIPFFGGDLVAWIWGGFSVSGATLKFFFVVHFLLPWALLFFVLFHLVFLHSSGRTSKLFCHGDYDKVVFFSFYWWKDGFNLLVFLFFFVFFFFFPFLLGDPEMFIEADPIMRPVHIVPEWYFLFAYAILRAIPNKVFGVFMLLLRILVFFLFIFFQNYCSVLDKMNKALVFFFFFVGVVLSWLGQCLVEVPFLFLSGAFSFLYFSLLFFFLFFLFFVGTVFSFVFIIIKIYWL
jgi:ubiquinol-cytochrome c reductase cytochrome b subunit